MEYISVREYSRRRGCSDTAVHKSIERGFILESALKRDISGKIRGINPELADKQWASTFKPTKAKNPKLAEAFANVKQDPPVVEPEPDAEFQPRGKNASTAKAQQMEAAYKAALRKLEYERKSGQLIPKDLTYRTLFALGQEIRTSLQAIPDRVIDEILAAPTRNDAHTVLTREIHEVLSRLSSMEKANVLEGL